MRTTTDRHARRQPAPAPTAPSATTSWVVGRTGALVGAGLVLAALSAIWVARVLLDRDVYVSQLGAPSEPTAAVFNTALLVLGVGGLLVGAACRGLRTSADARTSGRARGLRPPGWLGAWPVSATVLCASAAFVVASRVTCTDGCPVPLTDGSTVQDLVHVGSAVVGFAAAAWAMLQVGWAGDRGRVPTGMRRASRAAAAAVALCAAAGGSLSVAAYRTDVGALLEFAAMTVGVLWLAGLAGWVAVTLHGPAGTPATGSGTGAEVGGVRPEAHPARAQHRPRPGVPDRRPGRCRLGVRQGAAGRGVRTRERSWRPVGA